MTDVSGWSDERRWQHDIYLFEAEGNRLIAQQEFDERLANENQIHAEKIAAQQLQVVQRWVWMTGLAALAAAMSAVAATMSAWLSFQG